MSSNIENDPLKMLMEKLDSISERITKLETPIVEKEDSKIEDPSITNAIGIIKDVLKDSLPKEKLDSMKLNELNIAYDILKNFKHETNKKLPAAPKQKADNEIKLEQHELGFTNVSSLEDEN